MRHNCAVQVFLNRNEKITKYVRRGEEWQPRHIGSFKSRAIFHYKSRIRTPVIAYEMFGLFLLT